MTLAFNDGLRNNRAAEIQIEIDAGSGAGKVRVYDGVQPAKGGAATTLLAELTLSDPCAPAPSGGQLTFTVPFSDSSADATGTATWFRVVDSDNNFVIDGTAGTSGTDMILTNDAITATEQVEATLFRLTEGNA